MQPVRAPPTSARPARLVSWFLHSFCHGCALRVGLQKKSLEGKRAPDSPLSKEAAFLRVCFLSQLGCPVFLSCNTCFYLFLFIYFSFKISLKFESVNIECGVSFWGGI